MAKNKTAKVLIVDDEHDMRDCLRAFLEAEDESGDPVQFEVSEAATGRGGFEAFRKALQDRTPFELVVMDINMPEWDGITAAECMRTLDPTSEIIIVSSTAESRRLEIEQRLEGRVVCAEKPIGAAKLRRWATRSVSRYRRADELARLRTAHNPVSCDVTASDKLRKTGSELLIDAMEKLLSLSGSKNLESKVQNLLYYCEAWALAMHDISVFPDIFLVAGSGVEMAPWTGEVDSKGEFNEAHEVISLVVESYGDMTNEQILEMISRERPWRAAWTRGIGSDISRADMKEYYRELFVS